MICYFRKGLKFSIKIKIKQQDWKFVNFKEMIKRAVNVKVKARLRSSTMVRDSDIRYFRGHFLSNNTTFNVQTKETTAKDSHSYEPKVKKVKLTSSRAVKTSESFE